MIPFILSRVALLLLASLTASCAVGLEVVRATKEETAREPVPTSAPASFDADIVGDNLRIRIQKADQVRIDKFEVETRKRYRRTETDSLDVLMDVINPAQYVWDLCLVLSAPFRSDYDVAWGPLGGLAAVVIPGVCTRGGWSHREDHLFDTSTSKTLVSSEVQPAPRGVVTDLRVVTDHEVMTVHTDHRGDASIPLSRLRHTSPPARTRVTVDHDGSLYAIDLDGQTVTCTRTGASTSR